MFESALPYFIFLGVTITIYSFQRNFHVKAIFNPAIILALLSMALFAGLRDRYVGTDTATYVYGFSNVLNESLEGNFSEIFFEEPGYYLLEVFVHLFTDQYWGLLFAVAVICSVNVLYIINKYSENKVLSLFIYITLGYYLFCFNAARQAIALSIYMLALPCIEKKQIVKYCIIVVIAAMFHKTILIMLPMYFILRMRYSWKSVSLIVILGFIIASALPGLIVSVSQIDEKYMLYASMKATGGYLLTSFYILLTIFFMIMRTNVVKEKIKEYDIFLLMLICGSVIYLVVLLTGAYIEITRFAAYFQIASIFLFAKIFNSNKHLVNIGVMTMICVGCLIYFYIFVTTMADLIPYTVNKELI